MSGKDLKAYNIRELREMIGLNQEEFAALAGISSVYLSQIETGNRRLTTEAAEKITDAFEWLCTLRFDGETEEEKGEASFGFSAKDIKRNHIASFYPEKLQKRIVELIEEEDRILEELNYILDMRELADPKMLKSWDEKRGKLSIPALVRENRKYIDDNVRVVKEEMASHKLQPVYKRSDVHFEKELLKKIR